MAQIQSFLHVRICQNTNVNTKRRQIQNEEDSCQMASTSTKTDTEMSHLIADQQWIAEYNERERATAELELELNKRINGEVPLGEC